MDFKELIKKRRAVRSFTSKKVSLEIIHEIIDQTCLAPSAHNSQPWRFAIIQNTDLMKRISDESKKNQLIALKDNPDPFCHQFDSMFKDPKFNVFYNASSLVIICGVKDKDPYLFQDCSLAAAYFMLSAADRGLGTCWVALGDNIIDIKLREEIGLTKDVEVIAPIIIGYPKESTEAPKRKSIILKEIKN